MNVYKLLKNHPIRWMTETAMMLALYIILKTISHYTTMFAWPQGGSIGVEFIVVIITFYRLGILSPFIVWFIGNMITDAFTGFLYS